VVAADEVWRLQNGSDAECRFFQAAARGGHYGERNSTQQGIYVLAPSGKLLGSKNSNRASAILALMKDGLAQWDKLTDAERHLPDDVRVRPGRRAEDRFPADGLALRITSRDLFGLSDPGDLSRMRWNHDFAWFGPTETRRWLPETVRVGHVFAVDAVQRLARLHLLDNVRGQTSPFDDDEVLEATLIAKVTAVRDTQIDLQLRGRTVARHVAREGQEHDWDFGVRTTLAGHATIERASGRPSALELVGLGHRWGRTRFNDRARNQQPTPIGFALTLTPATPRGRMIPAFLFRYPAGWDR